jgi:cyclic-di-GMP-binding protein
MPSFDVASKVDWAEVTNALNQAEKEVGQRFDFKGTDAAITRNEHGILIEANSEDRARAAYVVLQEKLIRRKVSLKHMDLQDPTKGPKGSSRLLVKVKEGIETEKAKEIIKLIKDSKMKVQASIHEQTVRISGKKRDDLQQVIQMLRSSAEDLNIEMQFLNFRD